MSITPNPTENILMNVPSWLLKAVKLGRAYVDGATVKESSSHKILGHLQASKGLLSALPGPLGTATKLGKLVSSLGANVQLGQLKDMVSTLQLISGVGAAASVLNLGVSVAGFALVLSRLKDLDGHLDVIEKKVDKVQKHLARRQLADVVTALQRCEDAFHGSPDHQVQVWRTEERVFHLHLVTVFMELFGDDFSALSSGSTNCLTWSEHGLDADEMARMLAWPMLCIQAQSEVLLLLGELGAARSISERVVTWLDRLKVDPLRFVQQRARGKAIGPNQAEELNAQAVELNKLLDAAQRDARSRLSLYDTMIERGIDSRRYVELIRGNNTPQILWLPASDLSAVQAETG